MSWQPSIGARVCDGGVSFRVWAPDRHRVEVVLYAGDRPAAVHPLDRAADGYWSGLVSGTGAGTRYMFRLDGVWDRPDPASRSQPAGVHGPSQVVDAAFPWTDAGWRGVPREALIIYELHVGTATAAGTFEALIERLAGLVELGITAIELMPIADFPGERNWGYDGVNLYAPARAYGGALGLKRLVDAAHAAGLAVLLDVVYNHFGPRGNYLPDFAAGYFTDRRRTPWGNALNFDGEGSRAVRAYFVENALTWAHEYHLDGLRLDATQEIADSSPEHVLRELARRVHETLPPERCFTIFAEDARNAARLIRPPAEGGFGLDGVWADDFCHEVRVTLTGEREGYLYAFAGGSLELAAVLRNGWLYQGQPDILTGKPRGTPVRDLPPASLVYCIQNHDQVGNRAFGERLNHIVSPAAYRAASALLLLAPCTPLLFMGQEWAATTPFLFFTDHDAEFGPLVTAGRRKEWADFAAFQGAETPDPQTPETFARSKLRWEEQAAPAHAPIRRLYRDLIALRRQEPACRVRDRVESEIHIAGEQAVTLLLTGSAGSAAPLLIIANLGGAASCELSLVGGGASAWTLILDTEDGIYGGTATSLPPRGRVDLVGPRTLVFRGGPQ